MIIIFIIGMKIYAFDLTSGGNAMLVVGGMDVVILLSGSFLLSREPLSFLSIRSAAHQQRTRPIWPPLPLPLPLAVLPLPLLCSSSSSSLCLPCHF